MQVKTIKKITGISDGDIATAWGRTDLGARQVNCFISVIDAFKIKHGVCNLTLSIAEARGLAANLQLMADHAENSK